MRVLFGFMELMNTTQKFSFSFSNLRCGPFGFNPRKIIAPTFDKLNEIE